MNRWSGVEEFVEVVNSGSFTAAARKLGVSTSHVSRRIDALESRLSTRLLYRTTRQITLTEVGKMYFDHCNNLIEKFAEVEALVTQMQTEPVGTLKITAPSIFGEKFIAPLANDFIKVHPKLSVEFHFTNDVVDIVHDGYDLAIRTGELKDSTLMAKKLAPRKLYTCASPSYLREHGIPQTLEDLQSHNCLVGLVDTWTYSDNGTCVQIKPKGRWHGNSGSAVLDASLRGLGLAQLPDYYVNQKILSGELVEVLHEYHAPDSAVWAVYSFNRNLSAKVRLFVDFLSDSFSHHLPWLEEEHQEESHSDDEQNQEAS
ncbi:LysR family transcriptional regulator [Enterovibrio nigricans]|uniref:DNA-binding transcriptional regulator, LysR family n=1 Tax=Enterovibrio nigricans DSM 22720 TaxID=1121868 RepID=A0A1T4U1U8_9GAMM|nr:LysR family transcriptional regulator [Enterovibrio nigricans]SKA46468.1 DNA-binding transcriptional regulator, LysR family [Enterovibrio nigricans DSM 22720]